MTPVMVMLVHVVVTCVTIPRSSVTFISILIWMVNKSIIMGLGTATQTPKYASLIDTYVTFHFRMIKTDRNKN